MDLAKFGDSLLFCSSAIASHCQSTVLTKTSRQEKVPAKTSSVYSNLMLKANVQGVRMVESRLSDGMPRPDVPYIGNRQI